MKDMKQLMQEYYLLYASYVIRDRAIPDVVDGLKPVQRRLLHALWLMHDGKMHKVANVAGQTMAFHPHGDAAIVEALVNLANKGFLLDMQGNFGNLLTGDPAAAARYIETRLSPLAIETLFNPALTPTVPSYDGRHVEPVIFPAKIPLLLMQGTDGIAVGMATYILPHNFVELLEAEIAYLEGRSYLIEPDFPTGGLMDASLYDKGRGKVRLRARFEIADPKTIVIREICYGTTTESLIRSIDEAAKKGKIKIDAIHDYTSDKVEIEIKLPRGAYASELIDSLCAYTECEISLVPQMIAIKDNLPWEGDVHQILELHAQNLQRYLQCELEIERDRLLEVVFAGNMERIFIENRLYKPIETISSYEEIHAVIEKGFEPFLFQLSRVPTEKDRERLLNLPLRRISRFDIEKNQQEIKAAKDSLAFVLQDLEDIKRFTIAFLKKMIDKYGKDYPRRTHIQSIERLDLRAIEMKEIAVGYDPAGGFIGTKVSGGKMMYCTNFDKILVFYSDASYQVFSIPEKQYVGRPGAHVMHIAVADKKTVLNVVYRDTKTRCCFAKRFVVDKYILEKTYAFLDEGMELLFLSADPSAGVELHYTPKLRQKYKVQQFQFHDYLVKGVMAKGVRMAPWEVDKLLEVPLTLRP